LRVPFPTALFSFVFVLPLEIRVLAKPFMLIFTSFKLKNKKNASTRPIRLHTHTHARTLRALTENRMMSSTAAEAAAAAATSAAAKYMSLQAILIDDVFIMYIHM